MPSTPPTPHGIPGHGSRQRDLMADLESSIGAARFARTAEWLLAEARYEAAQWRLAWHEHRAEASLPETEISKFPWESR